jgi:hypothetical protein
MFEPKNLRKWSLPDNYMGEIWPNHYSAGVGQSRDSDALERSNFRVMLRVLGGESDVVTVVRESHWAVGWVEWIAIEADGTPESDKALQIADKQVEHLGNYPVLNESDFLEEEQDEADETWSRCYSPQERIDYIREHRDQFDFRDFADMIGCVRGQYFAGDASELLR